MIEYRRNLNESTLGEIRQGKVTQIRDHKLCTNDLKYLQKEKRRIRFDSNPKFTSPRRSDHRILSLNLFKVMYHHEAQTYENSIVIRRGFKTVKYVVS